MHLHHLERLQGPRGTEERVRGGGVLPAVREALRKLEQRRGRPLEPLQASAAAAVAAVSSLQSGPAIAMRSARSCTASALQLGTLRSSYSRFVRYIFRMPDETILPGL